MGVPGPWGRDPRRPDNQLKTHTHTEKEKAKLGFTGFYWVLPSFGRYGGFLNRCYRVEPGFTGFLPSFFSCFSEFYMFVAGFDRVLLGFTGFYWILPSFIWFRPV